MLAREMPRQLTQRPYKKGHYIYLRCSNKLFILFKIKYYTFSYKIMMINTKDGTDFNNNGTSDNIK